ncbi:activity-regulated cytoskeleton associated protein 1-like [Stomoxys calcitrans]|uniref:activity-regulated cytoskeleton associated protein 1-like n=1 Tax=Stomoxys calcitrans TaxID=35570 RepID=UPI0027E25864|nr:activity-regulated cytoskeleton associated protein 1-like [Stomoxys calcitrans]
MGNKIVQMSSKQLQQIIEAVSVSAAVNSAAPAETITPKSKASFGNCPSNFGGTRNHDVVEEFITSIVTYEEIECISDEDALKGISLLFFGLASIWWQGVRKEAKTWADALNLIRGHFSPTKPAYQIYMEIFEKNQDENTPIDTFVNIKYRKHISRHDIKSFRDLLEKGRLIEHNITEDRREKNTTVYSASGMKRPYSNFQGHKNIKYSKRRAVECIQRPQAANIPTPPPLPSLI